MLAPFATQSRPTDYTSDRLYNYFYVPTQGPSQGATLGRTGLATHATLSGNPDKPVRAVTHMGGAVYAAAGGALWKVQNGTATNIGVINDDVDTQMDAAASLVCIVAGGAYYTSDGSTVRSRSTGQVQTPNGVAVMDGYAVVTGADATRGDRVAYSAVDDQTSFAGLDFFTAEKDPDPIVGIIRDHNELRVFGSRTTEVLVNTGGVVPFERVSGALMERGCHRASTIAKMDNGAYWVGDDKKVYRSFGSAPEIISSGELSEFLTDKTILGGFNFEDRGRKFYAVRVEGQSTWAINLATGLWSEFTTTASHSPWIATDAVDIDGVWYFGTANGTIATQSGWQDEGQTIRAEAWGVPLVERWNQVNLLEIAMDTGRGDIGRDRVINLQTTRDGKNWGGSRQFDLGMQGAYRKMARFKALGRHRDFFQMRAWVTDPVQRDLYGGRIG